MSSLEQKHNNPLNNSTSKQQYSFPKTNRFKQHFKTQGTDSFYEIPNTRQKIGFSFGKVAKYQFNKHEKNNQSPPPGSYQVEGDLQKLLKKKQGIKILFGRQECKSGNLFKNTDSPGPARYNPNPEVITKKISRQMTLGKVHSSKRLIEEDPLPGPGAYHINSLILNENKVLSKQPKLSYGKIIFPKTRRERMKTQSSPKLSKVQSQLGLPNITYKGDSIIEKNKGFSISRAQRFHQQFVNENPGPGSYSKFSQFVDLSHH